MRIKHLYILITMSGVLAFGCTKSNNNTPDDQSIEIQVNSNLGKIGVSALGILAPSFISGTVIDKTSKLAISGVSVKRKSNNFGSMTDNLGQYVLIFSATFPSVDTLIFSYIGYKTQIKEVNYSPSGNYTVNCELEEAD